jgi:hypothetical protein
MSAAQEEVLSQWLRLCSESSESSQVTRPQHGTVFKAMEAGHVAHACNPNYQGGRDQED